MIEVTVNKGGERIKLQVPDGATVQDIAGDGVEVFLDGEPAEAKTKVKAGQTVTAVPQTRGAA